MAMSKNMATTKTVLSTVGSAAAAAMVARSIVNEFLPHEIRSFLLSSMQSIFNGRFSSETTMIIDEFDGLESNQIFEAAQLYIGTRTKNSSSTSASAKRLKVKKPESEKAIQVGVERNEEIVEEFEGVKLRWVLQCHRVETKNFYNPGDINSTLRSESRCFHLTFHKKHKDMVLAKYLPHILEAADFLKQEMKSTKLFTVDGNNMYRGPEAGWSSVNLNHPATFETLAMDSQQKKMIIDDLNRFSGRKEYYRRVGKAWKRGYLLYGPPGTGKSSLVAAMANYLNFDIYDMELRSLRSDSDLRKLLIGTANRSILVVEDIDCSIDLKDRESESVGVRLPVGFQHQQQKVTLSGLLNFIDGLWSSCGDERIIIFTTNHKEKLDPALLRPGRMDVHIHMSYCTFGGFNILARNYLGVQDHKLFKEIEILIEAAEVSPAEVAEQLMKHDKPDPALESLLNFLKLKKIKNAEVKAKESEVETQSQLNKGSKVDEPQKIEKPEDMIKKLEVKSQPEANNEGQVEEPAKDVEGQNGDSLS